MNNASIAAFCEAGRDEIISAIAGVHDPGVVRIGSAIAKVGNSSLVIVFTDLETRRPAPMQEAWRQGFARLT